MHVEVSRLMLTAFPQIRRSLLIRISCIILYMAFACRGVSLHTILLPEVVLKSDIFRPLLSNAEQFWAEIIDPRLILQMF